VTSVWPSVLAAILLEGKIPRSEWHCIKWYGYSGTYITLHYTRRKPIFQRQQIILQYCGTVLNSVNIVTTTATLFVWQWELSRYGWSYVHIFTDTKCVGRSFPTWGYVEYNGHITKTLVYIQCIMYKSCTPQICRKACCTTMTSVSGANARTNATTRTSRPVPSPVFGEMNAPYDCESSRPGAVLSGHYFQQMLTAAGITSKPDLFCVWMRHLAHPQTCTKTEIVRVGHFTDNVETCHTSSWERQRHFTEEQDTSVSQLTHCFLQISSLGTSCLLSMCQSWQGSPWCFSLHCHYYLCCLVNACPLHCLQLGHLMETLQCPVWTLESAGSPAGTDYLMPRVGSHGESPPSVILISRMLFRSVSQHKLRLNLTINYNHFLTNS